MMIRNAAIIITVLFWGSLLLPSNANAQRRDYFTVEEIEHVRDANEIDRRIDVLIKTVDRRLFVINRDDSQVKQVSKDQDKWGELPSGTRLELLSDISQILQKAIDDIDDLAERKEMNEKVMKGNVNDESDQITQRTLKANDQRFPAAVHNLADAARRFLPTFELLNKQTTNELERGSILRSIESCNLIIEASEQIARPVDKKRKN